MGMRGIAQRVCAGEGGSFGEGQGGRHRGAPVIDSDDSCIIVPATLSPGPPSATPHNPFESPDLSPVDISESLTAPSAWLEPQLQVTSDPLEFLENVMNDVLHRHPNEVGEAYRVKLTDVNVRWPSGETCRPRACCGDGRGPPTPPGPRRWERAAWISRERGARAHAPVSTSSRFRGWLVLCALRAGSVGLCKRTRVRSTPRACQRVQALPPTLPAWSRPGAEGPRRHQRDERVGERDGRLTEGGRGRGKKARSYPRSCGARACELRRHPLGLDGRVLRRACSLRGFRCTAREEGFVQ